MIDYFTKIGNFTYHISFFLTTSNYEYKLKKVKNNMTLSNIEIKDNLSESNKL